jgi:hypothetical protein
MRASKRASLERARLERLRVELERREEIARLIRLAEAGATIIKPRPLPETGD